MYRYIGGGSFIDGLPARDLEEVTPEQQGALALGISLGLYVEVLDEGVSEVPVVSTEEEQEYDEGNPGSAV